MNTDCGNLDSITRRTFVGATGASLGALAATLALPVQALAASGKPAVRYPLHIPPLADTPTNYALQAAPSVVNLGDDSQASALA